jgi:hypothetical protein
VVHAHRPARGADTDLLGEREQPPAVADEHVIMRHLVLLFEFDWNRSRRVSDFADAPAMAGACDFKRLSISREVSPELGVSPDLGPCDTGFEAG